MHVRRLPRRSSQHPAFTLATLLALLYLFFVSIALMSSSITFFGKDFAEKLLTTTANPFVGLLIGIVATSLIQSSSTTTSMVVSLVAADALSLQGAIPIVMGANVGTSVTNTLVAVAQIGRAQEFRRSFAAATVHDFFNLIVIVILFPIQVTTDFLGITAGFLENVFGQLGGLTLANPLKTATKPVVGALEATTGQSGPLLLMLAFVLLFLSLRYIVILLKTLVIGKVEAFFTEKLFRNAGTALIFGFVLTLMVQSSSITTSLAVPLAGAGILTIRQIFAMTLGANAGTTFTAILASLITGSQIAVTVAFSHLVFNVVGILLIWPIQRVPIFLAESLATWAVKYKALPLLYIGIVFFLLPLIGIYLGG